MERMGLGDNNYWKVIEIHDKSISTFTQVEVSNTDLRHTN